MRSCHKLNFTRGRRIANRDFPPFAEKRQSAPKAETLATVFPPDGLAMVRNVNTGFSPARWGNCPWKCRLSGGPTVFRRLKRQTSVLGLLFAEKMQIITLSSVFGRFNESHMRGERDVD
jgi:hypothetical protein